MSERMSGTSARTAGGRRSTRVIMPRAPPSSLEQSGLLGRTVPYRSGSVPRAGHVGGHGDPAPPPPRPDVSVAPVPWTAPITEGGPGMDQRHVSQQTDQDVVPLELGQRRGGRDPDQERRAIEQRPVRARAEEVRRQMLLEPTSIGPLRRAEVLGVEPQEDLAIGRRPR